ncbi:LysR family transcriptional regulator substrate-binding protein [Bordetella pertussis]|nr:LysR family transcriptional regulator substrate-binding protein [Bordetella pertussis]ULZ58905.1 LysR family transcriptional regulator substrate-binding protein [Bordetella pertussis]
MHVQLIERPVPELFAALQEGDADALVTTYAPQHIEAVKMPLHQEKLYESTYQLVAPPEHRFARSRRPVPLAKLVNEDWILPAQDSMLRKEIDWVFRRAGLLPPVPVVEANNPTTSIQLVVAGIGLGFAHGETLQNVPRHRRPHPHLALPASAQVALIYRAKRVNEKVQALRAALGL